MNTNVALQRSSIEGAAESDVGERGADGDVNEKTKFVGTEIAAENGGSTALAGERSGNGSVGRHRKVGGRFFRALRSGVGELPFSGDVTLGRILGLLRLAYFKAVAIHEDELDFCFFVEEIAVGDYEIGDLAFFNRAEPVCNTENLGRGQRQRAQRRFGSEPGIDRFLRGLEKIFRVGDRS